MLAVPRLSRLPALKVPPLATLSWPELSTAPLIEAAPSILAVARFSRLPALKAPAAGHAQLAGVVSSAADVHLTLDAQAVLIVQACRR